MSVRVRYSSELYHHGILGQKWGVRRYQNPDGSYTPEGLKRYGRVKTFKPKHTVHGYNKQNRYLTEEHVIKKGTKMYRMTRTENEDSTGPTYVSYQPADRNLYKWYISEEGFYTGKNTYEKTFELTEDLRIPSVSKVKESYNKALKKYGEDELFYGAKQYVVGNKVLNQDVGAAEKDRKKCQQIFSDYQSHAGSDVAELENGNVALIDSNGNVLKAYNIPWKTMKNAMSYERRIRRYDMYVEMYGNDELSAFELGMETLMQQKKIRDFIINDLATQGYNAIVDLAGVGLVVKNGSEYHRNGIEPLIIFDRQKSLEETNTDQTHYNNTIYNRGTAADRSIKRSKLPKDYRTKVK